MADKTGIATDAELMRGVGNRLRALRRARRLPITRVAQEAGLDRDTVSRAERGENPTLLTLVRLLRVHGRLNALDAFIPEPEVSPMAAVRARKGKARDG